MQSNADIVIKINNVWYAYNGRSVLEKVNFSVKERDFLAVIGPNGGGKTTLVKLILGLIEPLRGDIRVFGSPPKENRHSIGYVPQEININRNFPISVQDVVLMGRRRPGRHCFLFSKKDRKTAIQALEKLEMETYRNANIGELSGGQQQRVYIARALVSEPEILFLDEPTASIDSHGQTDFYALLKELNRKITIVVISHDVMVLSPYIKSVACVNRHVHYHDSGEITGDMLDATYSCPVELVAHGLPHRVLKSHGDIK